MSWRRLWKSSIVKYTNIDLVVIFQLLTNSSIAIRKKPVDFDDELRIGDVWYDIFSKTLWPIGMQT